MAEALLIVGGEPALRSLTDAYTTWRSWVQADKVPGDVVAPYLLDWWRRSMGAKVALAPTLPWFTPPHIPTGKDDPMMKEWNAAASDVWRVLSAYGPDHPKWLRLAGIIKDYAESAPRAKRATSPPARQSTSEGEPAAG